MIKAMETRPCEARVKEWELFRLEEARESLHNPTAEMNHANPRQPRRSPHLPFSPSGATGRTTNEQFAGVVQLCSRISVKSFVWLSLSIVTMVL